jgi:hypothetical protein
MTTTAVAPVEVGEDGPRSTSHPRRRKSLPMLRIGVGLMALVLICSAIYAAAPDGAVRDAMPLLLANFALQLMPFLWERELDPFSPTVFTALNATVASGSILAALLDNPTPNFGGLVEASYDQSVSLINSVSLVNLLASTAYYCGYYGTAPRRPANVVSLAVPEWNARRLRMVAIVCTGIFVVAYAIFQSRLGLGITSVSLADGKAVWRESDDGMAWLSRAVDLGCLPLTLGTAYLLRDRISARLKRKHLALAFAVAFMAFLILRLGTRGSAVYFLLVVGMIVHYLWRRIPTALIAGAGFAIIVAIAILGDQRGRKDEDTELTNTSRFRPAHVLVRHEEDRSRLGAAAFAMDTFPTKLNYLYGESFLALALTPIPRFLWHEKNLYTPMRDNAIVYVLAGAPVPLAFPFVLYVNFSWAGIFVGMGLWGMFHRRLYERLKRRQFQAGAVVIYALTLIYFSPTALGFAASLGTVVPAWLALRFIVRRKRRAGTAGAPRAAVA